MVINFARPAKAELAIGFFIAAKVREAFNLDICIAIFGLETFDRRIEFCRFFRFQLVAGLLPVVPPIAAEPQFVTVLVPVDAAIRAHWLTSCAESSPGWKKEPLS